MVSAEMIERKLYDRFTSGGLVIPMGIMTTAEQITRPAINFAVRSGELETANLRSATIMQTFTIVCTVCTKNIRMDGESFRRAEAHSLVSWAIQRMWMSDLGLDITPIQPRSWEETTDAELLSAGLFTAEIRATCRGGMDRLDEDGQTALLATALASFTLPESSEPETVRLQAQIDVETT